MLNSKSRIHYINSQLRVYKLPEKLIRNLIILYLLSVSALTLQAQSGYTIKNIHASVRGTSSLHDWESQITNVTCAGSFLLKDNVLTAIKNVEVKIKVKGIKSTEGKIMDNKTYEAFKSDEYPVITCTFINAQVSTDNTNSVTVEAPAFLTMAGSKKEIHLIAKGKVLANGDIQLSGSQKLTMTDYNMKPPTAVLGTIKVGDDVVVNFEFLLVKSLKKVSLKKA